MNNSFCFRGCSRRQFLSGLAACAGCAAGAGLLSAVSARSASAAARPKVRVVFCEALNDKPIWPNIGYNFTTRRNHVMSVLTQGCPEIEFLCTTVTDKPEQALEVLKGDADVQGYLVCVQGLGWSNDIVKLCGTGKPTLLVDNLFGGSGHFLTKQPQIMHSGKPVDWVSSSNDKDLVASVRKFELLQQGRSPAEIAAAFRELRRQRTAKTRNWSCKSDPVTFANFDRALSQLRKTKLLVVGGAWGGAPFSKAAKEVFGVEFVGIDFKELQAAYEAADAKAAGEFAARWFDTAERVVEPSRAEVEKSGLMYVAMKKLMEQHEARGISINCLGGFYGGHIKAYPCLGFSQLNNDGLVGGCEGDQMSALTMTVMGALTGRPGFISDPVIDTSKNAIVYVHCVGMTRPFGPNGPANPYHIRSHSEDRKGAAIQSFLPKGYLTTTLEMNPMTRQIIMHQAKTIRNNLSDMACRTKLEAVVKGDLEKLTENWGNGWHRVTFYGDLKDCVTELASRLKLEVVQEA